MYVQTTPFGPRFLHLGRARPIPRRHTEVTRTARATFGVSAANFDIHDRHQTESETPDARNR